MESIICDEDLPDEVIIAAEYARSSLLPVKSRGRYNKAYADFLEWRRKKDVKKINEKVILVYVQELSQCFAPISLWSIVSMLKSSMLIKENINISRYCQVRALLKRKSEGYNPKKSKILSGEQISEFILQAPQMEKVVYIATNNP